jgi:hypothetical protein
MNNFVITGPNTVTAQLFYNAAGSVVTDTGIKASLATNCMTDTFSVTGSGGTTPPVICGTNSGYHSKAFTVMICYIIFTIATTRNYSFVGLL